MKGYIYDVETEEVVAVIEGETCEACEEVAYELNYYIDDEDYGLTYTPAFGTIDAVILTDKTKYYKAEDITKDQQKNGTKHSRYRLLIFK